MKKLQIISVVTIISLLLFGCASVTAKPPEPPLPTAFEADCSTAFNGISIAAHITWRSASDCVLQIKEPSNLSGVTIQWDGEFIKLKYGILEQKINPNDFPEAAFGYAIVDVLSAFLIDDKSAAKFDGSDWLYTGVSPSGQYEILIDSDDGNIKTLRVPESGIEANFENFALLS